MPRVQLAVTTDRDSRVGRATSFGSVADAYERARPGYPDAAVAWLAGGTPCDVLEQVDALFDAHAVGGEIELPYLTECFRTPVR